MNIYYVKDHKILRFWSLEEAHISFTTSLYDSSHIYCACAVRKCSKIWYKALKCAERPYKNL